MAVIVVEKPAVGVTLLRLNRPEVLNALNMELRHAVAAEVARFGADADSRCLVVTGNEKAFAAGADIGEMAGVGPVEIYHRNIEAFLAAIPSCPKPVIAAVNGFCLGGGFEVALACDVIVAGEGAQFGLPEVRLGILPGGGGTQRLSRAIGRQLALRYMLTGDRFGAAEARAMGLVADVVADDKVVETALVLAGRIAQQPPLAVAQIKEAVRLGLDAPLPAALALERRAYYFLAASEDKAEGVSAFMEKRKPQFKGR